MRNYDVLRIIKNPKRLDAITINLYCGQNQRILTIEQEQIMRQIAGYVIDGGAISVAELNEASLNISSYFSTRSVPLRPAKSFHLYPSGTVLLSPSSSFSS